MFTLNTVLRETITLAGKTNASSSASGGARASSSLVDDEIDILAQENPDDDDDEVFGNKINNNVTPAKTPEVTRQKDRTPLGPGGDEDLPAGFETPVGGGEGFDFGGGGYDLPCFLLFVCLL